MIIPAGIVFLPIRGAGDGSNLALAARSVARLLMGLGLLFALALGSPNARAQSAPAGSNDSTGLDFFRPPANMFQTLGEYRTAPGSGGTVTTDMLNLRLDHSVDLSPQWILAFRTDLPLLAKNPISATNPAGEFLYGVGDADFQAAIIHNFTQRWAAGAGLRLIVPTGDEALGSGKWRLMPIAGFRYALPEITASSYFEPIVRYDVSVAGDPTKKNISNLQFGPALNFGLPQRWFVTLYPSQDIRWNFGDAVTGQTGKLFLPFDARVGRKLSDNATVSFELGVPIIRDYPVYNLKTEVRLNLTF